jgi:hypothetical protein
MEYEVAEIAEALICPSAIRLVRQLMWSYEGNNSVRCIRRFAHEQLQCDMYIRKGGVH